MKQYDVDLKKVPLSTQKMVYYPTNKIRVPVNKKNVIESGIVKEVFIRESTGYEILDKAGVNAAFESKFYPLTKKTNLNIEYTLKLNQR